MRWSRSATAASLLGAMDGGASVALLGVSALAGRSPWTCRPQEGGTLLDVKKIIAEIDAVLKRHEEYRASSKYDDLSDLKRGVTNEVLTMLEATIERIAPPGSRYRKH